MFFLKKSWKKNSLNKPDIEVCSKKYRIINYRQGREGHFLGEGFYFLVNSYICQKLTKQTYQLPLTHIIYSLLPEMKYRSTNNE